MITNRKKYRGTMHETRRSTKLYPAFVEPEASKKAKETCALLHRGSPVLCFYEPYRGRVVRGRKQKFDDRLSRFPLMQLCTFIEPPLFFFSRPIQARTFPAPVELGEPAAIIFSGRISCAGTVSGNLGSPERCY